MFRSSRVLSTPALLLVLTPALAAAQAAGTPQGSSSQNDAFRFRLPTLTVTAQKEAEDKQKVPVSVTAVPKDTIENADIHIHGERPHGQRHRLSLGVHRQGAADVSAEQRLGRTGDRLRRARA
jgi:hypothetical protein